MKKLLVLFILTLPTPLFGAEPAPKPGKGKVVSSRFLDDDLDAHIASLRTRIGINRRDQGPFGLYQVPGKAPTLSEKLAKPVKRTPFRAYIKKIEISVISAREKEFLVGARMFRLGQVFPIHSGGERLKVQVVAVEPDRVTFKNLGSGEKAVKSMTTNLPNGMTAHNGNLRVPGVTSRSNGEVAPLELDNDSPPLAP